MPVRRCTAGDRALERPWGPGGHREPGWAEAIPGAQLRVLAKQNHGVKAEALAPALREAFLGVN